MEVNSVSVARIMQTPVATINGTANCCRTVNAHEYNKCIIACFYSPQHVPYISELTPGTNRSLVSFTSLVISSDNVNRGLVLFTMSASFTSLVTIKSLNFNK